MTRERRSIGASVHALTGLPEFNLAVFALLLNFPWEVLQLRLYAGMANAPYAEAVAGCSRATLGDMAILLLAHGSVAAAAGSRRWIVEPSGLQLVSFIAIGAAVTAGIERLATSGRWIGTWSYGSAMPVVPGIDIGLAPLLQWLVLPPLLVWFVRRQSAGCRVGGDAPR